MFKHKILLIAAALTYFGTNTVSLADNALSMVDVKKLNNVRLLDNYSFKRSVSKNIVIKDKQAATDVEEDGAPTGPDTQISPVYLADRFEASSPRYIREDFNSKIPYSDEIFRDHTSLNTYYFYPAGYLLNYNATDGFDINFLHRTRTDETEDELVVLTFTLIPRQLNGGMSLLRELARYAIKPANNKPVDLLRLPVSSAKVNMSGLSSFLAEDNVVVVNSPQKVGDPIKVRATMTQSQKEDVVASIRDGGLSGDIVFKTYNNSFELVIPYFVSFTEFAGQWLTDITELSTTESFKNLSPHPLLLSGVVVYARDKSADRVRRYQLPLATPTIMEAGATASADKIFSQLVASYGEVVSVWPDFERVSCDECLNEIEREILVSPAQASRTDLPIEAIPNIFNQFSLFKVLVEVRSNLFSPDNGFSEIKTFTLRSDSTQQNVTLYVNRDSSESVPSFEYRIKPYHLDGENFEFGNWKSNNGVMDITVTAADIMPLVSNED